MDQMSKHRSPRPLSRHRHQRKPGDHPATSQKATIDQARDRKRSKIFQFGLSLLFALLLILVGTAVSIAFYLEYYPQGVFRTEEVNWPLILSPVAVTVLIGLAFLLKGWSWVGFRHKTLWDWLQVFLLPLILGIYTIVNSTQQITIANEQRKNEVFQNYTSAIQDLILSKGLLQSQPHDAVRVIATTQTAIVLRQIDKKQAAALLLYLYHLNLINTTNPIITLSNDDFSNIRLATYLDASGKLIHVNLSNANLQGINLEGADLEGVILKHANLNDATLNGANLSNADLSDADLSQTDCAGILKGGLLSFVWNNVLYVFPQVYTQATDFRGANLHGSDFSDALFGEAIITRQQLKQAKSLKGADLSGISNQP